MTGVSCPETEGPWKVFGKSDWWFLIQAHKNLVNFFQEGKNVKISNFIGLFFLKGKLVEAKTLTKVSSCDTEGP